MFLIFNGFICLWWLSIVPVNEKQTITCTAIANGGNAEWDFAFQRYLDSNVAAESSKLLYGLSCYTDPLVLQRW